MGEVIDFKARYLDLLKSSLTASLYDESAWRLIEGPMSQHVQGKPLKKLKRALVRGILNLATRQRVVLLRKRPYQPELREQGLDWPLFGYTMTGRHRLDVLQQAIETIVAESVPGDIIETGVWRGGSMIFASALLDLLNETERSIWCADSFEGMPVPTVAGEGFSGTEDFSDRAYLTVSVDQVKNNFRRFNVLTDRIKFLKGWFSDTLPTAPIEKLAILRLDGDLYESTMDALKPLYPKVSRGGYVIVDDYGCWKGCQKAIDEYRAEHAITSPLIQIDPFAVYWRVE